MTPDRRKFAIDLEFGGLSMDEYERECQQKKKYIDFIYRLLMRMDIESLERMIDHAIDQIR